MKHKVSELTGSLLDAAVAKAEGLPVHPGRDRFVVADSIDTGYADQIAPSRIPGHADPIIDRERISVRWLSAVRPGEIEDLAGPWVAHVFKPTATPVMMRGAAMSDPTIGEPQGLHIYRSGPTRLIAAMRAFVTAKLGDEVDL